ncbi:MAG: hypothetical protein DLM72_14715 [Candidatus Nitrosopolaris wilkensis]|nr:MAG: hypothetical protein DLM72_14715 [Candidatus Nitrosopolaris wilkensis]
MYQGRKKRYIFAAIIAIPVILVAFFAAEQQHPYRNSKTWNFDSYPENSSIPNTFVRIDTGGTQAKGTWAVKPDETAPSNPNVLARLSNTKTGSGYHMLIQAEGAYSNFEAGVKFKIMSGREQQVAGLIVRFQDTSAYFVLQADALSHRFSLCRAQPGIIVCTQDTDVSITIGQWHSIMVQVAGAGGEPGIVGYLDGKRLLQRYDQHYMTGGQIGLWTKGDSIVYFDDLGVAY